MSVCPHAQPSFAGRKEDIYADKMILLINPDKCFRGILTELQQNRVNNKIGVNVESAQSACLGFLHKVS